MNHKICIILLLCITASTKTKAEENLSWEKGRGRFIPTLDVEAALAGVNNNYFGNDRAVFGEHSDFWREFQLTGGGTLEWDTQNVGHFSSDLAWVFVSSGGYDAALSNIDNKYVNRISWHLANIGWNKTFKSEEGDINVSFSGGRQEFVLSSGFILGTGGDDGGNRGNEWIGPHDVWRFAFSGKVELEHQTFQIYQLTPDDDAFSHTHIVGADITLHDKNLGSLAFGRMDILRTEIEERKNCICTTFVMDTGQLLEKGRILKQNMPGSVRQN